MSIVTDDLNKEIIVLGGGCFWCTEAVFKMLKGILSVEPGYAGGTKEYPIYEEVSSGTTGHAEVVEIQFEPEKISLEKILTVFFATHNPTTLNRQGDDIGEQYRSIILYTTEQQRKKIRHFIDGLNNSTKKGKKIVTQVVPLGPFFPAENHHKNYYKNHSEQRYCQVVINPKLERVKKKFAELLKNY